MLALVPTFADLPLSTRAAAAVNAIDAYPLTIRAAMRARCTRGVANRCGTPRPGEARGSRAPNVDRRPARRERSSTPEPVPAPAGPITAETPADVRRRVETGESLVESCPPSIGVPWLTVRGWANGGRL